MTDRPGAEVIRASAMTGTTSTSYLRTGRGAPVLLLTHAHESARRALAAAPRQISVIAPVLHASDADAASVAADSSADLRTFLDALGIHTVDVVVSPPFLEVVRHLSASEPDRVRRVLPLNEGDSEDAIAAVLTHLVDSHPAGAAPIH